MTKLQTNILLCHLLLIPSILACTLTPNDAVGPEQRDNNTTNGCTADQVRFERGCFDKCTQDSDCSDKQVCDGVGSNKLCVTTANINCPSPKVSANHEGQNLCVEDCTLDDQACGANMQCLYISSTRKGCLPVPSTAPGPCDQPNAPSTCQATTPRMWAPMSYLSGFTVPNPADTKCCRDFNADGIPDNAVGDGLSLQDTFFDALNETFSNDLVHIWEHQGIDLNNGGTYTLHMWRGGVDGDGLSQIHPSSVEAGAQAKYTAKATLTGDQLTATTDLWKFRGFAGIVIPWHVHNVQIEATVDLQESQKGNGVVLKEGKVSGLLYPKELFDEYNAFATEHCSCIDTAAGPLRQPLVQYERDNIKGARCVEANADSCDSKDPMGAQCFYLQRNVCIAVPLIADIMPDTAGDHIGQDCYDNTLGIPCDAISVGITFEGNATSIAP